QRSDAQVRHRSGKTRSGDAGGKGPSIELSGCESCRLKIQAIELKEASVSKQTVKVPDIGTDQAAELTEILVSEGDTLEVEQSIIVLETEKASVEIPSSHAGKVLSILVKEGDELKTGAAIL